MKKQFRKHWNGSRIIARKTETWKELRENNKEIEEDDEEKSLINRVFFSLISKMLKTVSYCFIR